MLHFVYANDFNPSSLLAVTMFRDRAVQFRTRLGWEVEVDEHGYEQDEYDRLNPMYIIWEKVDGTHGGSLRLMPTTGDTMLNEHFLELTDGVRIQSPFIWECTRFCVAPYSKPGVSAALMLGVLEIALQSHIEHIAGVFDARMVRIYRRIGWGPTVLGTAGTGREAISVGLWPCDAKFRSAILSRAGVSSETSRQWLERCFGASRDANVANVA